MLPAYAGMIPDLSNAARSQSSAPRVCGDDPLGEFSLWIDPRVLPAYAGMIPHRLATSSRHSGAPRVCGDDPHQIAGLHEG